LLRRDERKALRGIPGIIDIPLVRELFAANDRALQEKDVIFTITPHILRTPNVTASDLSPIWIGTEDDIRLKSAPPISVFERQDVGPREQPWERQGGVEGEEVPEDAQPEEQEPTGTEPPPQIVPPSQPQPAVPETESETPTSVPAEQVTPEPTQTQPVEEEIPTEEPPQEPAVEQQQGQPSSVVPTVKPPEAEQPAEEATAEAVISFTSPNVNPPVGSDVVVNVQLEGAQKSGSISLFLSFDPASIQIKNVMQGPYVTPGAFTKSFDNARGIVQINASRSPSPQASGIVATIVLSGLKPGQATLNLNSAVIRDSSANVIPVTFLPFTIEFQ
jgi:general secretion pathway protein D